MYGWLCKYEQFHVVLSEPDPDFVNFENVVYDLKNGNTYQHSVEFCFRHVIRARYIADTGVSEKVGGFFGNLGGNNKGIRQIMAVLGIAVSNNRSLQKAAYLCGPRRNGKSTLAKFLREVLSIGAVAGLNMDDFANPFAPAILEHALVSIATDEVKTSMSPKAVARFKQVVGGDFFTAQRKGVQHRTISTNVFVIMISNSLVKIRRADDPEGAVKRRIWLIKTGETIDPAYVDSHMLNFLLDERDAILSLAVKAAGYYLKNPALITEVDDDEFYDDSAVGVDDAIEDFCTEFLQYQGGDAGVLIADCFAKFESLYPDIANANRLKLNGFAARIKKFLQHYSVKKTIRGSLLLGYNFCEGENEK